MPTIDETIEAKIKAENKIRDILQGLNTLFNVRVNYVELDSESIREVRKEECNLEHYHVTLHIRLWINIFLA